MTIDHWAKLLLFGTSLEEKLLTFQPAPSLDQDPIEGSLGPTPKIWEAPKFPGRPEALSKIGRTPFPSVHQLHLSEERGKVLHFFANHELLALELMALVLLRFPEAPPSFRKGMIQVITEEQGHLKLYIARMKELGVELGDLPVNDYFWKSMKDVRSPLDFTVQMSLTFEQANLDFSFYYMNAVRAVNDHSTAALLERVFKEEIRHVKHGLVWFNRWRSQNADQSEWDAYRQLLPFPLNPQRAKGPIFCEDARRLVGLSENYIRELGAYSGSKGRPPTLWIYNPHCDNEILRGRIGFTPTASTKKIGTDLQVVPAYLSQKTDIVLVDRKPSIEWIESLQSAGLEVPEFLEFNSVTRTKPTPGSTKTGQLSDAIQSPKLSGIEPWGWSPEVTSLFKPLLPRLVDADGGNSEFARSALSQHSFIPEHLGKIFSKSWSVEFLNQWLLKNKTDSQFFGTLEDTGLVHTQWGSVRDSISKTIELHHRAMIKAPYGTAGMQVKDISELKNLDGPLGGWIRKLLRTQGGVIIEPFLNRVADLSIQLKIQDQETTLLEVRQFITGSHHEYQGTLLGPKLFRLNPQTLRFFHAAFQPWKEFLRQLGDQLRKEGYRGPAGVDAFLWKTQKGELKLKPLVELNPRWTMGRVALELEKSLIPGVSGAWTFLTLKELARLGFSNAQEFAQTMKSKYPVQTERAGGGRRIRSGVLLTNDPAQAQSVLSCLVTFPNPELLLDWQARSGESVKSLTRTAQ